MLLALQAGRDPKVLWITSEPLPKGSRAAGTAAGRAGIGDHVMPHDPNGLVSRWSGAARRGTIAHIAYALMGLLAVAFVLHRFVA